MLAPSQSQVSVAIYDYLMQSGWAKDLVITFLGNQVQGDLPLLTVRNLVAGPLKSVDLDVLPGDLVAILGPSGSGKSALVRSLLSAAEVKVKSGESSYASVHKAITQGRIGVSFDSPAFYPELTVQENVMHQARLQGLDRENAKIHVAQVLELVKLEADASKRAESLSLGAQRRLNVALAVVHQPQVAVLDCPLRGLNHKETQELQLILRDVHAKGVSLIITASELREISGLAKRVLVLEGQDLRPLGMGQGLFTVAVRTKDQDYDQLRLMLQNSTNQVWEAEEALWFKTSEPEQSMQQVVSLVSKQGKQLAELWCADDGAR